MERYSGVLLHPTSLAGKYGMGSLGQEARDFVNWLADSGQKIWQILPLGPTDWSHSPYQCYSAFAGNPDLVDLEDLVERGYLRKDDLKSSERFPLTRINYEKVRIFREPLLNEAFIKFRVNGGFEHEDYLQFWRENGWWLESWSLFYACRKNLPGKDWSHWEQGLLKRESEILNLYYHRFLGDVEFQRFIQYIFFSQWFSLKKFANEMGIRIFGDIPLYVSYDSVDVWANQDIFLLDDHHKPTLVGGVPPDYFSETGQLWGNPLYNWPKLRHRHYDWWIARMHYNLKLFDLVRIDHFRGLESFWAIPYKEKTAVNGKWMKADGDAMLRILQSQLGKLPIIAEDLGTITEEVRDLRRKYYLPGMKVLQFAFTQDSRNEHLPFNYTNDFVAYTGTHDNDSTSGWLKKLTKEEKHQIRKFFGPGPIDTWRMIRLALSSVAEIAVTPMQDILELGSSARMNKPGTVKGNWLWRLPQNKEIQRAGNKLRELIVVFGRQS
jgi:4-alpha-glucanotransferase